MTTFDRITKTLAWLSLIIGLSGLIYYGIQFQSTHKSTLDEVRKLTFHESERAREEIKTDLENVSKVAQMVADKLTNGKLLYQNIDNELRSVLTDKNNNLFAIGVSYLPGVVQPGLYSRYAFQVPADQSINIESKPYDYTESGNPRTAWFTEAVKLGEPVWQQPKFGQTSETFLVGLSIPFFDAPGSKKVVGVVSVNYSLSELHNIMKRKNIWDKGYGIIMSTQGRLIYHPDELVVKRQDARFNDANDNGQDPEEIFFQKMLKLGLQHQNEIIDSTNPINDDKLMLLFQPIQNTNWILGVVCLKDELAINARQLFEFKRNLAYAGTLFLAALAFLLFNRNQPTRRARWLASGAVSVAFSLGICVLWYNVYNSASFSDTTGESITTFQELGELQTHYNHVAKVMHEQAPLYIPTGVFVQSVKFVGANEVVVTGYVWQKQALDKSANSELEMTVPAGSTIAHSDALGFVIPEAEESQIRFTSNDVDYESTYAGIKTTGWYFKATLRQDFNYSRYPLDKEMVWLRLQQNDSKRNIVLVPDLEAYSLRYSSALPGLEKEGFVLPGWNIDGTYFSLKQANFNTNFGIENFVGKQGYPELYFNIMISREFFSPFISNTFQVMMIFVILFLVAICSTVKGDSDRFGFNAFTVLSIATALLFAAMLWHSSLRDQLSVSGIGYFESFYFVSYVMIVMVCINAVLLSSRINIPLIERHENLTPRLLFWPLVTGSLFVVTALTFH